MCFFPLPFNTLEVIHPWKVIGLGFLALSATGTVSVLGRSSDDLSPPTKPLRLLSVWDKRHASIDSLTQDNGRKQLPLIFIFSGYDKILSQKEFEEVLTSQFRGYKSVTAWKRQKWLAWCSWSCVCVLKQSNGSGLS